LDGRRAGAGAAAGAGRGMTGRAVLAAVAILVSAAAPPAGVPPGPAATDKLLAALKSAPNAEMAGMIEAKLQEAWHDQATAAVQMLVDHAGQSVQGGKMQDALQDSDAAITLQPGLADLYRRRAEIRFALGDDRGTFADLAQAISREPRLVPAWADLSRFAEARHDNKRALEAWRKVLELDPKTEGGAKRVERLQHLLNGEPI
jgi:tetratricopeptide (TPR) repeat protein